MKIPKPNLTVKNEQRNQLAKREDIFKRWKEHFEKVLNRIDPETEATLTISCE
jgi:hypothetical protein